MIKEKLSSRQLIFSRNLASGMSQTDAAKGAGYSFARARITGAELLKKPKIKEEVNRTRQDIETALGINPKWCAERYVRLADKAEAKGENSTARGCLDSLTKLMGWSECNNVSSSREKAFQVESLLAQIQSE